MFFCCSAPSAPGCVVVVTCATWPLYTTQVRCHTLRHRSMKTIPYILALGSALFVPASGFTSEKPAAPPEKFFRLIDMLDLETASEPQISPDGTKVVFVRNFSDIMKDRKRSNLWIVDFGGNDLRPLTSGGANDFSPRWSPDGKRLLYASSAEGSIQIYVRWLDTGQTGKVTSVQKSPTSMTWS